MRVNKIRLNVAMAERGLNFTTLSQKSGVSKQTLSAINNGKTCKPDIILKLADALNMNTEDLITGAITCPE